MLPKCGESNSPFCGSHTCVAMETHCIAPKFHSPLGDKIVPEVSKRFYMSDLFPIYAMNKK